MILLFTSPFIQKNLIQNKQPLKINHQKEKIPKEKRIINPETIKENSKDLKITPTLSRRINLDRLGVSHLNCKW